MTETSSALDGSAPPVTDATTATETSPATAEHADAGTDRESEIRQLRAEAKRHRLAKNAAEAERDTLRGRVDQQDKREVERLAGDRLQNANDIWLTTDIAALRDEEGALDADKISERLDAVLEQRPHWRKTNGPPRTSQAASARRSSSRRASAKPLSLAPQPVGLLASASEDP